MTTRPDPWEKYVRPCLPELIRRLKVDSILDVLFAKYLISRQEYDAIQSKPTREEKTRYLIINCLMITSENSYRGFLSVLKECESCKELASLLSAKEQEFMQTAMGAGSLETKPTKALAPIPNDLDTTDEYRSSRSNARKRKSTDAPLPGFQPWETSKKFRSDPLMTPSTQAQQDVALPRKTEVALVRPPEGLLKRDTVTVFVSRGYRDESLLIDEALGKLFRIHLKTNFHLKLLNLDDSFKSENSLIITSDSVVNVKVALIRMPASEFGRKSDSFLRLLLSIFPKFRNKIRRVDTDSDWEEFVAQIFCKDIEFLVEFFDDEKLQQAFAACLQYQFSSLKEIRFTIGCLPCWILDVGKASQYHDDFPREGNE